MTDELGIPRKRILVVDDEPNLVQVARLRLEAAGYDVLEAFDGEEALHKAYAEQPDLILLDLMLPKIDGFQVCRTLKHDVRTRQIPILLFTARVSKEDQQRGAESGADGVILKPYDAKTLLGKISAALGAPPPRGAA